MPDSQTVYNKIISILPYFRRMYKKKLNYLKKLLKNANFEALF